MPWHWNILCLNPKEVNLIFRKFSCLLLKKHCQNLKVDIIINFAVKLGCKGHGFWWQLQFYLLQKFSCLPLFLMLCNGWLTSPPSLCTLLGLRSFSPAAVSYDMPLLLAVKADYCRLRRELGSVETRLAGIMASKWWGRMGRSKKVAGLTLAKFIYNYK